MPMPLRGRVQQSVAALDPKRAVRFEVGSKHDLSTVQGVEAEPEPTVDVVRGVPRGVLRVVRADGTTTDVEMEPAAETARERGRQRRAVRP